ncbi:MAG: 23S rRNA (guanosine(2251)-2'-O)-methyltransferase RlmB [Bacteroidota bacterium]
MQTNQNIIYGRHPVIEALETGISIDKVFLLQGTKGELEVKLRQLTRQRNIPLIMAPKEKLSQLSNRGNHQGIVAIMGIIAYYRIDELLPTILEEKKDPLFVILDGITDIRNFGAIARSAELSGVDALIVPTRKSAQINAASLKASAGALAHIPVCRESNIIAAIDLLQMNGVQVLASDLKADKIIYDLDLKEPTAIVLGAEDKGISKPVARQADETFIIPQTGRADSFNVSVAAGIMLYEVNRQRTQSLD